jgi:hypothetical protein
MTPFPDFLGRTRRQFQTIIELTITRFDQGLMQVALGEIAGQVAFGHGRRQRARLVHRRFAILPGGLGHRGIGAARRDCAVRESDEKTGGKWGYAVQDVFARDEGCRETAGRSRSPIGDEDLAGP